MLNTHIQLDGQACTSHYVKWLQTIIAHQNLLKSPTPLAAIIKQLAMLSAPAILIWAGNPAKAAADPNLPYWSMLQYTVTDHDLSRQPQSISQSNTIWENVSVSASASQGSAVVAGSANFEDGSLKLAMSGSSAGGYGSSAGATVAIADRISILGDLGTTVNGFIVADVHGIVHGTPASDYWNSTSRASFYVSVSSPGIDQFYRFNIPESISGIYDERIEIPFSLGGNSGINWMQFNAGLGMQLSGNWVMDFGNTVSFSIILPDGYSYVSAGGLTFRPLNPSTGGVPEPAIWAMMIAGFGLTGAALRRRQRVAAVLG